MSHPAGPAPPVNPPAPPPGPPPVQVLALLAELAHGGCPTWGIAINPLGEPMLRTAHIPPTICRACGLTPQATRFTGCPLKLDENAIAVASMPPELQHADPSD